MCTHNYVCVYAINLEVLRLFRMLITGSHGHKYLNTLSTQPLSDTNTCKTGANKYDIYLGFITYLV